MINFLFSLIIYKGKRKYSLNITQTKFCRWPRAPPSDGGEYSTWFNFISPHANFYYDPALESLRSILSPCFYSCPSLTRQERTKSEYVTTLIELSNTSIIARNMAPHCTYNTVQIPYGLQQLQDQLLPILLESFQSFWPLGSIPLAFLPSLTIPSLF